MLQKGRYQVRSETVSGEEIGTGGRRQQAMQSFWVVVDTENDNQVVRRVVDGNPQTDRAYQAATDYASELNNRQTTSSPE